MDAGMVEFAVSGGAVQYSEGYYVYVLSAARPRGERAGRRFESEVGGGAQRR